MRLILKCLALALVLTLVSPLSAGPSAESARLFDWYYSTEKPYQTLRRAAIAAGKSGWLVDRMNGGERIPQASARELALELERHPALGQLGRDTLKERFPPESAAFNLKTSPVKKGADELTILFSRMSEKIDDLEATMARNNYDNGSYPQLKVDIYNTYRHQGAGGILFGEERGFFQSAINFKFVGESDAGTFAFGLSSELYRWDNFQRPVSRDVFDANGLGFLAEIGTGGFEFSIGTNQAIQFSTLIMSEPLFPQTDLFYINQGQFWQPDKVVLAQDLKFPATAKPMRGLYARRQGTGKWWPFTNMEFIYAPHWQFSETFQPKTSDTALRLDLDKSGLFGGFIDSNLLYVTLARSGTDEDLIEGYTAAPLLKQQGSFNWAVGLDSQLADGTNLIGEFAANAFQQTDFVGGSDLISRFSDTAYIVQLSRPVSFFNLAVEYGKVGSYFVTSARERNSANQAGATLNSLMDSRAGWANAGTGDFPWPAWMYPALAGADPANPDDPIVYENGALSAGQEAPGSGGLYPQSWITVARNPQALVNNTTRMVLKTEATWSFVSMGVSAGLVNQINPTGPWVQAAPYIENDTGRGYMFDENFGQQYSSVPAPFGAPPPLVPNNENPQYHQWNWARQTDGMATFTNPLTGATATNPVHWQALTQDGYRQVALNLLLSEKGLGDSNVLQNSVKAVNYMTGTLDFDLKSLLGRVKSFNLLITGQLLDVAPSIGLPNFGDPGDPTANAKASYLTQGVVVAYLRYGITNDFEVIGMLGNETWRSDHGYFPLMGVINSQGLGFDLNMDSILSTLKLHVRSRKMNYTDSFYSERNFSSWETMIGTVLSY